MAHEHGLKRAGSIRWLLVSLVSLVVSALLWAGLSGQPSLKDLSASGLPLDVDINVRQVEMT
jgi:hypothetical protein